MLDNAKDTGDPAVLKTVKPINYIVITDGAPSQSRSSFRCPLFHGLVCFCSG